MENSLEKAIVRKLQEDLPLVPRPYEVIAEELGITEEELLNKIQDLSKKKILKRIGAVLHHRTVGFNANAMVVWSVPEEKISDSVNKMISFKEVSHCYERKALSNWPYNIYTMIHAETIEDCEAIILELAKNTGIASYEVLYSTRELKKRSMKYFTE
jgi:DNA-binding Lrp family transcriptional regulator